MAANAPAIGYLALLRANPRFKNLWTANVISLLGDWLDFVALSEVAINLTSKPDSPYTSAQVLTAMMLARLLPIIVLSPFAGNVADRYPRQRVMAICNIVSFACVLLMLPFLTTEGLPVILVLLFVKMGALTFFHPSYSAAVPTIVSIEHLQQANALSMTTYAAMTALGGSLGGAVVNAVGVRPALVFDAVTFLIANLFLLRIVMPPAPLAGEAHAPLKEFKEGLQLLRLTPRVLPALLLAPLLDSTGSGVFGPLMAEQAWPQHKPDGTLAIALVSGIIYTAFGLGSVLGPLLLQRISQATPQGMQWRVVPALVIQGLMLMLFGLAAPFWLGLMGAAIAATARAVVWIYSATLLQMQVPDRFRGRVSSVQLALIGLFNSASALLIQLGIDQGWINARGAAVSLGAYSCAIGILYFFLRRIPLAVASESDATPAATE